ncbi:Ig-like domain-containing protein [Streptomyces avermitilis]|uniref:Ig-like domain-containing protein n=1 Tax=Streptomyces avermitilis TaxID=33903 RepID=UPI0033E68416
MTTRAGTSRTGRLAPARGAAATCAPGPADRSQGAQMQRSDARVDTAGRPRPAVTHRAAPKATETLSGAHTNIADGQTVDVGMPISVTFAHPFSAAERARTERRSKVTAAGVEGSWSWVRDRNPGDGGRVDFRPRGHWQPGTQVTVRAGSGSTGHFTVGTVVGSQDTVAPGNGHGDRNMGRDDWRAGSAPT